MSERAELRSSARESMLEIERLWAHDRVRLAMSPTNTVEEGTTGPCRYCGEPWRRWMGSKIDGHALCLVSPEIRDDIVAIIARSAMLRVEDVAAQLGLTTAVMRAWWRTARRR